MDVEPECVVTRRVPRCEEFYPTNYLFNKFLSYSMFHTCNLHTYLCSCWRSAKKKRTSTRSEDDSTFTVHHGVLVFDYFSGCCKILTRQK